MNIAAYCRVSTDKADQLNSLETQKKFFAEYTQRTGHTLVRLYADEGLSGTKTKNRREFLRLMADAEGGLFDLVVVKDISRFARNTVDLLQNIRRLKALEIETLFLTANMTSMGNSEFVLTIFGALAQEESANTSKRIKFGKRVNAQQGRVPNLVFGYDKTSGDYFHLSINQREAEVVRQMFLWYVSEGCGGAKIAGRLNASGVKTKRGCDWSQNAVRRILTNTLYIGQIVNGKQEVADFLTGQRSNRSESEWLVTQQPDLAIVEADIFAAAQRIMAQRGQAFHADRTRHSNRHLFSTLIRCGCCGWSFRRTERTYKNTYVRWVCSGRSGRGAASCPNTSAVDEGQLAGALAAYFTQILSLQPDALGHMVGALAGSVQQGDSGKAAQRAVRAKLAKLHRMRQKYMDMYADDLISRDELQEKTCGMRLDAERLERELQLTAGAVQEQQLLSALSGAFPSLDSAVDLRRMTNAQLKQIVRSIEVGADGTVDIYLQSLGRPKSNFSTT